MTPKTFSSPYSSAISAQCEKGEQLGLYSKSLYMGMYVGQLEVNNVAWANHGMLPAFRLMYVPFMVTRHLGFPARPSQTSSGVSELLKDVEG